MIQSIQLVKPYFRFAPAKAPPKGAVGQNTFRHHPVKDTLVFASQLKPLPSADLEFLDRINQELEGQHIQRAREHYLVKGAGLKRQFDVPDNKGSRSSLSHDADFDKLLKLHQEHPDHLEIKRLYAAVLASTVDTPLAGEKTRLENLRVQIDTIDPNPNEPPKTDKSPSKKIYVALDNQPIEKLTSAIEPSPGATAKIVVNLKDDLVFDDIKGGDDRLVGEFKSLFLQILEKRTSLIRNQGYADPVDYYAHITGHPLKALRQKALEWLNKTKRLYWHAIAPVFTTARSGTEVLQKSSVARDVVEDKIFSSLDEHIEERFSFSNIAEMMKKTIESLGIPYLQLVRSIHFETMAQFEAFLQSRSSGGRIFIDHIATGQKDPRAFVSPTQPQEVWLSIPLEEDSQSCSTFLHETGHALHHSHTDEALPFALRQLGNNAVTETYAFLFEELMKNTHWLTHIAGVSPKQARQIVRHFARKDAYYFRKHLCKLLFELELVDGTDLTDKPKKFRRSMIEHTGQVDDATSRWSLHVDDDFYVVDYILAYVLKGQLEEYLKQHFGSAQTQGENWYQNPKAGEFLKALWAKGNLSPEELSAHLGHNNPFDETPYLKQLKTALNIVKSRKKPSPKSSR